MIRTGTVQRSSSLSLRGILNWEIEWNDVEINPIRSRESLAARQRQAFLSQEIAVLYRVASDGSERLHSHAYASVVHPCVLPSAPNANWNPELGNNENDVQAKTPNEGQVRNTWLHVVLLNMFNVDHAHRSQALLAFCLTAMTRIT